MNRLTRNAASLCIAALAGCIAASGAFAAPAPIAVSAPNAQSLVTAAMQAHPEASLIGLHADVPSGKGNAIIACNDPARIGKVSSPHDMEIIGKTALVTARLDKKNVYETMLPQRDASGRSVGMMVEQIPLSKAPDEVEALRMSIAARAEIEKGLESQAWLFAGK